ncbi:hypothetical protein CC80DRAFT_531004 [Byssothecium circinans]|uniref:Uncharacterized protein n=1 Tax=Byssothecium circinans TaxID=147558 RepID=A0A6A5UQ22_9PLEO|nr:hypothetical protein CC80DRAFT_531004 [Byssothecium circinans]
MRERGRNVVAGVWSGLCDLGVLGLSAMMGAPLASCSGIFPFSEGLWGLGWSYGGMFFSFGFGFAGRGVALVVVAVNGGRGAWKIDAQVVVVPRRRIRGIFFASRVVVGVPDRHGGDLAAIVIDEFGREKWPASMTVTLWVLQAESRLREDKTEGLGR